MTVRTAELMMAIVLAIASILLMIKSAELSIGWIPGAGPGAGAWPFWLSAGMLLTSLATIVRWFMKTTPESRSQEQFMSPQAIRVVGFSVLGLLGLLGGTHFIGIYFSVALFLLFFLRFMGRHTWPTTVGLMVGAPIVIFIFFEWALKVSMPKGISEPLFYPIYDLIY